MAQVRTKPVISGAEQSPELQPGSQSSSPAKVVPWKTPAEQPIRPVSDETVSKVDEARERALAAYREAADRIKASYQQGQRKAADLVQRTRNRARLVAHEHPLSIVAGVAGFAFAMGVLLRVWRSNRYE